MLECTFYDIISDCVGLFKFYFFFFSRSNNFENQLKIWKIVQQFLTKLRLNPKRSWNLSG